MYNTSIDTTGVWNVNTSTNVSYNNMPQYVMIDKTVGSQKNLTKSMNLSERLELSFRTNWLELAVDGSVNYMHSRNELQSQSNLDTWQFSYGGSAIINTPWGTSLSTDLHQNSRRGYNDKAMNTNELVWNAQISQGFLRGKPLTVMLQFYDILDNLSNFSRTVNAMQRSDTQYNNINSYACCTWFTASICLAERWVAKAWVLATEAIVQEDQEGLWACLPEASVASAPRRWSSAHDVKEVFIK